MDKDTKILLQAIIDAKIKHLQSLLKVMENASKVDYSVGAIDAYKDIKGIIEKLGE